MLEERHRSLSTFLFQNLSDTSGVRHFVSTRMGGFSRAPYESLNLGFHVGDNAKDVLKNREHFAANIGIPLPHFTTAKQVHSGTVTIVTERMRGYGAVDHETAVEATDAMVTDIPGICLMVLLADCAPVLFFHPQKRVIGVAHAGWRGTVKLAAQKVVEALKEKFDCKLTEVLVGIGPSIGPCHYEVGLEVISQVENMFHNTAGYKSTRAGRMADSGKVSQDLTNDPPGIGEASDRKGYFNLWEANKQQIVEAGIPAQNIEVAQICTYCQAHLFFSERHERGKTGRFGAGIMLSV